VLLQVGSTEILLDDARRVEERIRAAGGPCVLQIFEDVPHGWQMLVPLVPEATTSLRSAADFIARKVEEASVAAPGVS
jgi:acetyl esterase/lipase